MDFALPFFSVVIVNYNGGSYLQGAVDSLKAQTDQDFELFVVDNASSDGSAETLDLSGLPAARLMVQDDNLGFAEGNNVAARMAGGDWLVLLNPDAVAAPDWLARLREATQHYPETAMFASAQIALEDDGLLDGAGDCYLGVGIPWRGGFGLPVARLPADEGEVFSPCGASAAYRLDCFLGAGGFDESFFCFCEDVDLAFRLRLEGHRCIFLPGAVVHHAGGAISGRASAFSVHLGARNRIWTYVKNTPPQLLWLTLPGAVFMNLAILARGLQTGRFGPTWAGLRDAFADLPRVLKQRREIQAGRRASFSQVTRAMSWNPLKMLRRRPHLVRLR
ncbi:MAG: glycosyltransferase family 2 protein [Hyphomonadaceae bacterium]|nr:glycosyltransferase family 2 protein [Hyphomonadaceae bacterium]